VTHPDPGQVRSDILTAARFLRGSSWPGDMAEQMERLADRLHRYAESPSCPHIETSDEGTSHCRLAAYQSRGTTTEDRVHHLLCNVPNAGACFRPTCRCACHGEAQP